MRILHAPNEIASSMMMTAKAQRELGHEVTTLELGTGPHSNGDIMLHVRGQEGVKNPQHRNEIWNAFIAEHLYSYDVYHFYFGATLFPDLSDLQLLRRHGKIIVMTYCGSDIVNHSPEMLAYLNDRAHGRESNPPLLIRPDQHRIASFIDQYAHAVIVNTVRFDHVPRMALMKRTHKGRAVPVDVNLWEQRANEVSLSGKDPNKIYICHAPSNRSKKGTDDILLVLEQLQQDGYPIEIILVEGVHPSQVHHYFAKADIVIDQMVLGFYGEFAIQMMALGKPVVVRYDPYLSVYDGFQPPIVNSDFTNLYANLVELIQDKHLRERIGRQSKAYVKEHHDYIKIGQDLIDLYDDLIHSRPICQIGNPSFYTQPQRPMFPTKQEEGAHYESEYIQKNLNDFQSNQQMASIYLQLKQPHNAVSFLIRCTEINSDCYEAYHELAAYFLNTFRYEQVKNALSHCIRLKPDTVSQWYHAAEERSKKERYHDAVTILLVLAEHDNKNPKYHCAIGRMYEQLELWNRAENAYGEALRRNPEHPTTIKLVETFCQNQNKPFDKGYYMKMIPTKWMT